MALLTIPGAVISASLRGEVRILDTESGKLLWRFDTARDFISLDGNTVSGAGIGGAGAIAVSQGMLYVNVGGRASGFLLAMSTE